MLKARLVRSVGQASGVFALIASNAGAQCTPDWIGGEQFPGVNGPVGASLVWDADGPGPLPPVLVVAGDFSFAGKLAAPRIATWDGTAWSAPFATGLDGPVRALTIYNGDLIAGGEFTHAGSTPAAGVARWDGSAWQPLGQGTDGAVYALTVFNGRLYAGGIFTAAGGAFASAVASWDDAAWSPVGTGGVDGTVYALGVLNSSLYVGGEFAHADALPAANIAQWNGTSWSALGPGISVGAAYAPAQVRSLLTDGALLYIGGMFDHAGGLVAYGVAEWNGSAWSSTGTGIYRTQSCGRYCVQHIPYRVRALTRFGSLIYAAVDPSLTYHFNGTSWSAAGALPAATSTVWTLTSLSSFNNTLYAGGSFGGLTSANNIARLSGAAWTPLTGMDGAVNGLALYNNRVVAAGTFTQADGVPAAGVASWDGAAWHAIGTGLTAPAYGAAAAGANLYVTAWPGGVLQWDGTAWTTLYGAGGFGAPPAIGTWNGQILAGLGGPGFGVPEGATSAVGSWNGSSWVPMGEANWVAHGPSSFATLNGTLYIAGPDSTGASPVCSWQGGEWAGVGTTALGFATAIAAHNSGLYASMSPGTGPGVVAQLIGTDWQQIGGTFDAAPASIASINGSLYAIGPFTAIDATPAGGLAQWDGAAWQPVGAGAVGAIATLAGFQNQLIAAGSFDSVGGHGFARFAVYGCPPAPPCYANCDGSTTPPVLNVLDFSCFLNRFAAGDTYANCDGSSTPPVLNVLDFSCFLNQFAAGCS